MGVADSIVHGQTKKDYAKLLSKLTGRTAEDLELDDGPLDPEVLELEDGPDGPLCP